MVASYSIGVVLVFTSNKLGSQVCKGKHRRTGDSTCIIVMNTCITLIKSLYSIKVQMWFYNQKTINFIYPFVLEQINFLELLTENIIINYKVTIANPNVRSRLQVG